MIIRIRKKDTKKWHQVGLPDEVIGGGKDVLSKYLLDICGKYGYKNTNLKCEKVKDEDRFVLYSDNKPIGEILPCYYDSPIDDNPINQV